MSSPRVLLVQLGECPDPVRDRFGGFHRWFEHAWDGPLTLHDARIAGVPRPDARDWDGLILTGSAASAVTPEPWMLEVVTLLREAHEVGTPTLGVCFGHQLLGLAFGARVIQNPRGWEVGTCEVTLSPRAQRDPLFEGLSPSVRVNQSHTDVVSDIPAGSALEAWGASGVCDTQILAAGEHVRGVQFHPEFKGEVIAAYMTARRERLTGAGLDVDGLVAAASDCPDGLRMMQNFRRHFVDKV